MKEEVEKQDNSDRKGGGGRRVQRKWKKMESRGKGRGGDQEGERKGDWLKRDEENERQRKGRGEGE